MDAAEHRLKTHHEAKVNASFHNVSTAVVSLVEATVQKRSITQAKRGLEKALENSAEAILEAVFYTFEYHSKEIASKMEGQEEETIEVDLNDLEEVGSGLLVPDEETDFTQEELEALDNLSEHEPE